MALWFRPKSRGLALSYDRQALLDEALKNWETLFELREEHSWKVLMRQLDIAHNQEILNLSKLELGEAGIQRLALHKGVVSFIHTFRMTLDEQFKLMRQKTNKKDGEPSYGKKVLGKPQKRQRPPLS
jgi:hypothetical protein